VTRAERVDHILCASALEAEVRELRLIAEHKPRYNRRSRFPERGVFLKLTRERFPRLSLVRKVLADGAVYVGPFGSARAAELAMAAAHEAIPLRQCTPRITARSRTNACVLHEMGRCGAPCAGLETETEYAAHVAVFVDAVTRDPAAVVDALEDRMAALAAEERYEDAAAQRDRLAAFVRAVASTQELTMLASCAQIIGARADGKGGWEIHVVRHGRLAAAGRAAPGVHPRAVVDALVATAETVVPGPGPVPCASSEEMSAVLRWLGQPGVRLVECDGEWSCPVGGAGRLRGWLASVEAAADAVEPFADRRGLRPLHQPARAVG